MKDQKVTKLVLASLFTAIAFISVFIINIPVVLFLKFEIKDALLALEALILGPWYSLLSSVVVALIEMVSISETGPIGAIMNVLSTVTFILPAGILYHNKKTLKNAVLGLCLGTLLMTSAMLLWNYLITPWYMETPREVVKAMLLPYFLPYNFLKGVLNSAITYMLYKPVMTVFRKMSILPKGEGTHQKSSAATVIYIVALIIVAVGAVSLILLNI